MMGKGENTMVQGFQGEYIRDAIVEEIRQKSRKEGWSKVVIGISGGKDSSVAAALCTRALGAENVYGILIPDSFQKDMDDSLRIVKSLRIPYKTVNIGPVHAAILESITVEKPGGENILSEEFLAGYDKASDLNIPPRIRMIVLRYIGQSLGALLCGTGNLSESTVGYCTKDGDTSCDFNPLGALTSLEVVEVGLTMEELPKDLVLKTPDDGLSGMPDEEKLGVSYKQIHSYIRNGGKLDEKSAEQRIREMEISSAHKRKMPHKILCDEGGRLLLKYEPYFR